jgi:hypothetical protein
MATKTKIIGAWDLQKVVETNRLTQLLADIHAVARIKGEDVDVAAWALAAIEHEPDPLHRARVLARVARDLTNAGEATAAVRVLRAALDASRLAGREGVLEALELGASTLAAVDQGNTLMRVSEAVEDVDKWLS